MKFATCRPRRIVNSLLKTLLRAFCRTGNVNPASGRPRDSATTTPKTGPYDNDGPLLFEMVANLVKNFRFAGPSDDSSVDKKSRGGSNPKFFSFGDILFDMGHVPVALHAGFKFFHIQFGLGGQVLKTFGIERGLIFKHEIVEFPKSLLVLLVGAHGGVGRSLGLFVKGQREMFKGHPHIAAEFLFHLFEDIGPLSAKGTFKIGKLDDSDLGTGTSHGWGLALGHGENGAFGTFKINLDIFLLGFFGQPLIRSFFL